jgi:tetraacyldisaccharide 4'-kinase
VNPLSSLYGAVVDARNRLYDRGSLSTHKLRGPVISIGNLTVGGSGKTPFLIMLGRLLQECGIALDVLSRGYRRRTRGVALVDPNGSSRDYGDEPLLIARTLGVPVIVGENRYAAGTFAEQEFGPQLHLLDDGFQHRQLARDFDIVLITPSDAHDQLLPAGRLREPMTSLSRADAVVLTDQTAAAGLPLPTQQLWRVQRSIVPPPIAGPCVAFCGIARPENFFAALRSAGATLAATHTFRDHHRYTTSDIRQLLRLRTSSHATAFLTTQKDAINLASHLAALQPLHVVPLQMTLAAPEAVLSTILAVLRQRTQVPA